MFSKTKFSFKKKKDYDDRITIAEVSAFGVNEAYRMLRTNLMFAMATKNKKTIAISSSYAGEGKSVTAANIAIAMSRMDSKTLLVDCDLRKPVQHKVFGVKNEKGVSTLLGKMSKIEDTIHKNVSENLDVLTSGPIPPNPTEMLASINMRELIEQLSDMYDYIVFDIPPINVVSDALTFSAFTGGLVIVCRQNETTFEALKHAVDSCKMVECDILGVVVNGIEETKGGYGKRYGYGKGYGYGKKYGYYNSYGSEK